jgi:hypothetical protein
VAGVLDRAFMLPGLVHAAAKEPALYGEPPKNLQEAVVLPFREFIKRDGCSRRCSSSPSCCCTKSATP